eukprot:jgi/Mesvir1/22740/Mv24107-RA.1
MANCKQSFMVTWPQSANSIIYRARHVGTSTRYPGSTVIRGIHLATFRATSKSGCSVSLDLSSSIQTPRRKAFSCSATVRTVEETGFAEMSAGKKRKIYMVGGKGGVGKTSLSASLAVKFAREGHPTLVVSTDPAHSLSDSLAQDVSGGEPVSVEGTDLPLWGLEINPDDAKDEFREFAGTDPKNIGKGVKDFMDSVGMGGMADQLADLKLGELLDTPPPGLDEAVAIAKVVKLMEKEEYAKFTRIVFDTAPTGHTLRLLSLPDFLDKSVGKIVRLRQKLMDAQAAIKGLFGATGDQDKAVEKLEDLKRRLQLVRELFRNPETTEFIIVTIPTIMAVSESSRLLASLRAENVPVKRMVINQVLPDSTDDCKFCRMRRKDQHRTMDVLKQDAGLMSLKTIEAPMFDLEIRGVPALQFMGDTVFGR